MNSKRIVFLGLLLLLVCGAVALHVFAAPREVPCPGTFGQGIAFPALHIDTGGRPIRNRTDWVDATVTLQYHVEVFEFENLNAEIIGRGNSSWGLQKRPFRLRFSEPVVMLCAGHAARNWTLIANHSDKTLMRNYAAYYLAGLLDGMDVSPYARFVDLYINGLYQGVYMLCIQMEVLPERVEITGHEDPRISEYFIQMDQRQIDDGVRGFDFVTVNRRHYQIRHPHNNMRTTYHAEYVRQFLIQLEDAIFHQNGNVFDLICKASFIDFYLVQELFKNQDAGFSSVFMTIQGQGDNRRLVMGPVWDFDISAGNAYYQGWAPIHGGYSPRGVWVTAVHPWFHGLLRIPEFADATAARWLQIRDNEVPQMMARIDHLATVYEPHFERNFDRWNIMGRYVWPNPPVVAQIDTFRGQVDYLLWFIQERAIWMDGFLLGD
ncbi:MAG: CotH kinase family protein [Defluviitaleaceae bacterium]|nr:CotH kinase family protein [Defluviitaleaceae bacterium]